MSLNFFSENKVVLWDTEFTAWEGCHTKGWDADKGQYKELIQIGAIIIDTDGLEIVDTFDRFVKPEINPELSEYIKDLTGITQENFENADSTESVIKVFKDWSQDLNLYSYFNDVEVLERNIELHNLDIELNDSRFRDITPFFREKGVPVDEWSSGSIARYFDKNAKLLRQHDALNDSKNMLEAIKLTRK